MKNCSIVYWKYIKNHKMSYIFKGLLSLTILTDYKNKRKSDNPLQQCLI